MTEHHTIPTFTIGQIIRHLKYDYRGVIVDVDPVFQDTEEWYKQMAVSLPPRRSIGSDTCIGSRKVRPWIGPT